jgi:glyceraldehyde 3-phosphate dehydrogenase
VLGFTELPLVSSDFRGDSRSSVVDGLMTTLPAGRRVARVVSWYDNEWGYASRVADLAAFISECELAEPRPQRVHVVERERMEQALRTVSYVSEDALL